MDDPLESAKAKLARANVHTTTAKREARRFIKRQAKPAFRIDVEGDPTETRPVGDVVTARIVLASGVPDLPLSFGARFGDAIHNYRSVLDHVAWQLVTHRTTPKLDPWAANRVQFPIYDTETRFEKHIAARLPGVAPPVIDYIKARHQYVGGKATNRALLALARFSNDDKHRALHVFIGRFRTMETEVSFTRCRPVSWANPPIRPTLKEGAVVTRFSYVITGPNHKIRMNLNPVAEVAIEEGLEFSSTLEGIKGEVTGILSAPEIVRAIT